MKQRRIIVPDRAEEHTGCAAPKALWNHPRILESLPAEVQHEPLLRIHGGGLTWGDAEKGRLEPVDLLEEATPAASHLARCGGIPIIERIRIPPVLGYLGDRV